MRRGAEAKSASEVSRRAVTRAAGVAFVGSLLPDLLPLSPAFAQAGLEPLGGQPPPGATASVKDFDYQIKYQRAFEAVLWNMPTIAIYSFRRAAFTNLGMNDNDIIAYSAPATPKLEAITGSTSVGPSINRPSLR